MSQNMKTMQRVVAVLVMAAAGVSALAAEPAAATAPAAVVSVRTVEAQAAQADAITATGRVQATSAAAISPRVSGHITALGKNAEGKALDAGMRVARGDVLFTLDTTALENTKSAAAAAVTSARAALEDLTAKPRPERVEQLTQAVKEFEVRLADKRRDEERYRRLVEEDKTAPAKRLEEVRTELAVLEAGRKAAQAQLDEAVNGPTKTQVAVAEARLKEAQAALKAAEDDLRDAVVRAPFDGLITRRDKGVGDYAATNPPTEVMNLVSLADMEAELRLPESYLGRVEAGKTTVLLRSPLMEEAAALAITRVVREIDAARGTFAVRVALGADGKGLVPGAFVKGEIDLGGAADVIVPARALLTEKEGISLLVARDGKAVREAVTVRDRLTEGVVVRGNVKPGEKVIIGGGKIKDGDVLPGAAKAAATATGPAQQ